MSVKSARDALALIAQAHITQDPDQSNLLSSEGEQLGDTQLGIYIIGDKVMINDPDGEDTYFQLVPIPPDDVFEI